MTMRRRMPKLVLGVALGLTSASALTEDFDLDWWTVDGGGVMYSTGDGFELAGTIGQPDAGVMTADGFTLAGGFWPGASVLLGDVDYDGDVDQSDLAALLASYARCVGEPRYNPDADFNGDDCVGQSDLAALLANYGEGT